MVIQCPECRTRFKVADEKLKPEGIKVRCARCKRVFSVAQPQAVPEQLAESIPQETSAGIAAPPLFEAAVNGAEELAAPPHEENSREESFDFDQPEEQKVPASDPFQDFARNGFGFDNPGKDEEGAEDRAAEAHGENDDFGFDIDSRSGDLFGKEFQESTSGNANESSIAGENDFFSFDPPLQEEEASSPSTSSFSDIERNTEFSFTEESEITSSDLRWEPAEEGQDSKRPSASAVPLEHDEFDFREATFPDDAPAPPPAPAAVAPPAAPPAPEVSAPEEVKSSQRTEVEKPAAPPKVPATPAKRPRKAPVSRLFLFLILLLLALAGAAAYFLQNGGPEAMGRLADRFTAQQTPPPAPSQIRLTNLRGFFVQNNGEGQIFAISGEAVNDSSASRSAISIKGVLFDEKGKPLLQQTVFAGNPLTEEKLRQLPFAKIEESMNNQFGDSLSNLNVAPGKSIPFTVVFKGLPPNLAEFTVEVADSKPGSK